jgi:hypothetical protein
MAGPPAAWIDAIDALIDSGVLRASVGNAGAAYVRRTHHWDAHGRAWLDLLDATTPRARAREVA